MEIGVHLLALLAQEGAALLRLTVRFLQSHRNALPGMQLRL